MTSTPDRPGPRSLRITFVALNYWPSVGGAQELVRQVAEGLAARGHDVEVLTTDALRGPSGRRPGRIPCRDERHGGVRIRRFSQPRWVRRAHRAYRLTVGQLSKAWPGGSDRPLSPLVAGPATPGLWWAIAKPSEPRDVVIACSAPFLTLVLPALARRRSSAAVIAMPLLHASRTRPHRQVLRALRRCDATLALTAFERDLQVSAGVDPSRCTVLTPGTEPEAYREIGPSDARARLGLPSRLTVGYIGRLAEYKGVDTLLDAAPLVWATHPDTTILIAGATTGWKGYISHPSRLEVPAKVELREDFDDADRDLLLAACDVIAFPSREESYGLSIVEAWAARRAVIAAGIPVVREVVRDGIDAKLVPPGDHRALATEISHLLSAPDEAASLAQAGRRHVEQDLDWSTIVEAWEQILLQRSPPPHFPMTLGGS